MPDDRLTLYETPEGAISVSDAKGRQEISVYKPRDGDLIHILIASRPPGKDRDYFQIIVLDEHLTRHIGSRLWKLTSHAPADDDRKG